MKIERPPIRVGRPYRVDDLHQYLVLVCDREYGRARALSNGQVGAEAVELRYERSRQEDDQGQVRCERAELCPGEAVGEEVCRATFLYPPDLEQSPAQDAFYSILFRAARNWHHALAVEQGVWNVPRWPEHLVPDSRKPVAGAGNDRECEPCHQPPEPPGVEDIQ